MADTPRVTVPVEPTEAMQEAATESLISQYDANASWDDAKDVIERLDCGSIYRAMLSAAPAPEGGADVPSSWSTRYQGIATRSDDKPEGGAVDVGREAIWKLVHEVWQLLDEAETDSAGITTPDQERWQAVSDAMDALEALVPDSAGPFWGGFPVNYFWPAPATREEAPDWTARTEAAWAENNREEAPADHVSDARQMVEAPAEAVPPDLLDVMERALQDAAELERRGMSPNIRLNKKERIILRLMVDALRAQPQAREEAQPVAVTIFCPECSLPHVDEGEWATTRRHKTHQCQGCGHEWRPFPFATVGVSHPTTPPAPEAEKLDPAIPAAVKSMLDRFDRAKGKGGYPTANERWAMRECLAALQAEQGAK
ncbi:hypothetical protein NI454_00910 [Brevundimonas diminuta]|uniref:hypothetical protein n=1 Tax=Brevundimonas diminuta TaxID=293 RepID=UPI0020975FF8|nr:hypothetical protein [Brevundimonas diminuta]MCO8028503.1 hypothetical protein [Brevundimonas diminuta]